MERKETTEEKEYQAFNQKGTSPIGNRLIVRFPKKSRKKTAKSQKS